MPIEADLFDPTTWQKYQWSIFAPEIQQRLEAKNPNNMFGDIKDRIAYLSQQLLEATQTNRLLMADSPSFSSTLCLLQNTTAPTIERAVLLRDERKDRWRLLFAGDRGVPKRLLAKLTSPGDGHGTETSQNHLSQQEHAATTARHKIAGGHFDTITKTDTMAKVRECLSKQ